MNKWSRLLHQQQSAPFSCLSDCSVGDGLRFFPVGLALDGEAVAVVEEVALDNCHLVMLHRYLEHALLDGVVGGCECGDGDVERAGVLLQERVAGHGERCRVAGDVP